MQEDKLKNLSQAEALVPLDTDGEEVEIELEGATNEAAPEIEEEAVELEEIEEPKAEDTEHDEYSNCRQKRIDKLTEKRI